MEMLFLLCSLCTTIFITSTKAEESSLNWNIKLNRQCTIGLYENDKTSQAYKDLKAEVESGIRQAYIGINNNFYSSSVAMVNCVQSHVMVGVLITTKNISDTELAAIKNKFTSSVNLRSTTFTRSILSYNLAALPLVRTTPVLYAKLDGSIAGKQFCKDRAGFKGSLANTLILADGISRAQPAQVIVYNHPCGGDEDKLLNNVQFYISQEGMMGTPDITLTTLAYRVVEQMIYDGTTWRLGLYLYKYLNDIELLGSAKKDSGLNDLEITYIGFGAVLGIIVLVLLIVWISDFARKRCCTGCCGEDEEDFHVAVHIEPASNEKGITNELFETEKINAAKTGNSDGEVSYEEVDDPTKMTHIVHPSPPQPEYHEMDTMKPDDKMAVLGSFQGPDEVDEVHIEAVYDNPVESGTAFEELLPPPHFNASSSSDDDDDESDVDEGKEVNVDDLGSLLSDMNGLLDEYESLGYRAPGSMLYPDDVVRKNRVPEYYPWPENRVLLHIGKDDDPLGDYMNASFVKDCKGNISYISTQAPLASTTNDFWRMIWERSVEVVVMVTPANLRGQEMCHQYWPRDQNACSYGDINVQLLKKELKPDFLVMTVAASLGEGEPRNIYLFRYMSWPQSDIPDNPKSIVAFMLEIREVCETFQSLPVFHCSSGRGMSAVLIALLNGMLCIEDTGTVNIKKVVRLLRKDVPCAVESFEQYKFLHEAMYQYALFNAN